MNKTNPTPCLGWLGRIFGHKFKSVDYFHTHCLRCGMPRGGWGS